ncbi:hypothetical protein [Paenibacillus sp. y28]|uniref:hypothetical protein n=1 Tax=Paenibacillus sp. y28 TaxID=3129110 RepID=UPI003018885A
MAFIRLRPDMKTAGGEVSDIIYDGCWVGTITLLYREGSRCCGSVQLDEDSLTRGVKNKVVSFVQAYVQEVIDAVDAVECDVTVTYSPLDHVIASENRVGVIRSWLDGEDDDADRLDYDKDVLPRFDDIDPYERDEVEMQSAMKASAGHSRWELVQVGESRNRVEYHLYDGKQQWLAEGFMVLQGADVYGDVVWRIDPEEGQIEQAAHLIVSDFDENQVDSFVINMYYEDELVESIELTHEDLLDWEEPAGLNRQEIEDYTLVLARDDAGTLTYEIYEQAHGGLPIGTATIDISQRQLTGFIDFRDPEARKDREQIAELLMQELDKEQEYESLNITMLVRNKPIDELHFEVEQVH